MKRDNRLYQFGMLKNLRQQNRSVKAYAIIEGNADYRGINGLITFSNEGQGTWVDVEVKGLPNYVPAEDGKQPIGPFGFHIHEGGSCAPMDGDNPFSESMGHYNPYNQPHGNHAGDFPVLFSNNGYARMSFFTNKFTPDQVIGRTVIIHLNPDDYRTQPAGNSGEKIACGVIVKV